MDSAFTPDPLIQAELKIAKSFTIQALHKNNQMAYTDHDGVRLPTLSRASIKTLLLPARCGAKQFVSPFNSLIHGLKQNGILSRMITAQLILLFINFKHDVCTAKVLWRSNSTISIILYKTLSKWTL